MAEAGSWTDRNAADANASALVLLQAAAARAEIGPFARRGRASPQSAAVCYRAAARLVAPAEKIRIQSAGIHEYGACRHARA